MKLTLKKEVVNSVVYESAEPKAAIRSVYVMKEWLATQNYDISTANGGWPKFINLEITCG